MYYLNDVHHSYGKTSVLKGLTADIRTDALVFIMGPSGSGKSTLLRLLSFLESPDRGQVRLRIRGEHDISSGKDCPWPRLTCVFQRQFLWPHLTLRMNMTLPLMAAGHLDIDLKVQRAIDLFDMSAFVDRYPNEVSGGQAQRAALGRALVLEPELILIDEAYVGLDLEQQAILNQHFLQLREAGVGLIVVTHSLQFTMSNADQVVVLEDGYLTELGTREIFLNPTSKFIQRIISQ